MKTFKRYVAMFATLAILAITMIIPAAHSYVYDWKIQTNAVYYEHDFGVDVKVDETLENGVKKDVKLTNTGKSPIFVKAMVVFTPIDDDGNPLTNQTISASDVTIEWNDTAITDGSWITVKGSIAERAETLSDNDSYSYPYLFFWNKALDAGTDTTAGESTENLISSVSVQNDQYKIRVDIITDAIYEGEVSAWCSAYGLTWDATNRTLSK